MKKPAVIATAPVVFLCVTPLILLAAWNIWIPYSYDYDELWSIVFANRDWGLLTQAILHHDLHPPLYYFALKLWTGIFGNSEPLARALSLLAALAALVTLLLWVRNQRKSFAIPSALFFSSASLFPFYAQEIRSYALLLFLSTAATLIHLYRIESYNGNRRFIWYGVLFALSLTHYFGLIYAAVLLLTDLVRAKTPRAIVERILLGALFLVWPIIHVTIGTLWHRTGGDFWITSNGPLTTISVFAKAIFPWPIAALERISSLSAETSGLVVFLVTIVLVAWSYYKAETSTKRPLRELVRVLVSFVTIITLIDIWSPISVSRYYIVLLPPASLLVGYVVEALWTAYRSKTQRILLSAGVLLYAAASAHYSFIVMSAHWKPRENWKDLGRIVEWNKVCNPHCWFLGGRDILTRKYEYYFRASMGADPDQASKSLQEILELPKSARLPIIIGHGRKWVGKIWRAYEGWDCFEPEQNSKRGVILIVSGGSGNVEGLHRCEDRP